jgi:hypothetical protein
VAFPFFSSLLGFLLQFMAFLVCCLGRECILLFLNVLFGALVRSRFACLPVFCLFCFDHPVGILLLCLPPLWLCSSIFRLS